MLKALHNQIFASKLREVFTASPLVLVYQAIGSVDATAAAAALQSSLGAGGSGAAAAGGGGGSDGDGGLTVHVCRMRNSVAAGAGEPALARLFQASNILVGFSLAGAGEAPAAAAAPEAASTSSAAASLATQPAAESLAKRASSLSDLIGPLFASAEAGAQQQQSQQQQQQQQPPPRLSHKALAQAFAAGAALPAKQPLLLVGAFYGRRPIRLADLKEWVALDEFQVYAGLLGALEAPLAALCDLDHAAADLAGALDAAAEAPVDVLDARVAAAGGMPG